MEVKDVKAGQNIYINSPANQTRMKVKCVWNDTENQAMETVWYLFWLLPVNYYLKYSDKAFMHFEAMNIKH
jgi:hypothetical protein